MKRLLTDFILILSANQFAYAQYNDDEIEMVEQLIEDGDKDDGLEADEEIQDDLMNDEIESEEMEDPFTKLEDLYKKEESEESADENDNEEIKDDEILFGEGLGLDSLDAVEIVVLLQRNFGIEVKDMKEGQKIFYSIDTLANYVYENR